jgi:hypothetical protein
MGFLSARPQNGIGLCFYPKALPEDGRKGLMCSHARDSGKGGELTGF